jgi:hypothetical protein
MQESLEKVRRGFARPIGRCVAAAFAVLSAGCAIEEPGDASTASQAITAAELLGRQATGPSTFNNRCVDNVETAFAALPQRPTGTMRYRSQGGVRLPPSSAKLEPFGSFDFHVQSITRFAGGFDNDRRWIAVSRKHEVDRAGFFLVHLADADGADGGRLLIPGKAYPSDPVAGRETRFYYPVRDTGHPGGMQAFGQFLAIASEAPEGLSSFIDIYDFRGGPGAGRVLQRFMIPLSTPSFPTKRIIGGVAMATLRDGRYLMFVLGQDKVREGWFFVSNGTNLTSTTQWLPLSYVKGDSSWDEYQNVTLVTECNSNQLYVVATGNATYLSDVLPGTDHGDLFRLSANSAGNVVMTRVARKTFVSEDGFCTFRAGATVHADKDGKLILYCHAHHANTDIIDGPDSKLKMAEWQRLGCLSTQTTCGSTCCSQGSACVNGSCCSVSNSCGSACCGGGTVCKNAARNLCCDSLSIACGSSCCTLGQQCVNNACVTPPPPPPPPPPVSCGIFQPCGPGGACPGNTICFGTTGCCGILR